MPTEFDPDIIQAAADSLYKRAASIVAGSVGLVLLAGFLPTFEATQHIGSAVAGAFIAGFVGYYIGTGRAFALRLQAQTALCQMQIERNTRKGPTVDAHAIAPAVSGFG